MKRILWIFLILVFEQTIYCQCNTKKWAEDNYTFIAHAQESIFEYVDDSGGVMALFEYIVRVDNQTKRYGSIIVIESVAVGNYNLIVPRTIRFNFSDRSSMSIDATSLMDLYYNEGVTKQKALFFIMDEQRKILSSKDVYQIKIIDNRVNKEITCNPFGALVKEQIQCVAKGL